MKDYVEDLLFSSYPPKMKICVLLIYRQAEVERNLKLCICRVCYGSEIFASTRVQALVRGS